MKMIDQGFLNYISSTVGPNCLKNIDPILVEEPRGFYKNYSCMIAKPNNTNEVSKILKGANDFSVGVVPHGGSTGLVGGQLGTSSSHILISLEKMKAVRDVCLSDSTYTVESGLTLGEFKALVRKDNRFFPLSLSSEGSCQLGGNLATNAGGVNVLKYGNMRDLCIGIEVVMASGEVINDLKGLKKDNMGIDIRNLIIGSEGTLGIITASSLRTFPKVTENIVALIAIDSPNMGLTILSELQKFFHHQIEAFELIKSTGLEFLKRSGFDFPEPFEQRPKWFILVDISTKVGFSNLQNDVESCLMSFINKKLCSDVVIAQNEKHKGQFWDIRHKIPEANRKVGAICSNDISLPTSKVHKFIIEADAKIFSISNSLIINCFGHLGDGNLHYNIFAQPNHDKRKLLSLKADIVKCINEIVYKYGGSCSAEHGVGRLRKSDMKKFSDMGKIKAMDQIKRAMDPKGILNPGVIFN